ncbi:pyruvate kinase [Cytobacillus sp. Hz8]|uniref:pyruvate kinase n=1 Tax=Cytobacillus sp. Hz8 TaxID=3347168 RepID=UPI0035E14D85
MVDRICTIGPASYNRERLTELMDHGMTVIRLNLSHGTYESHNQIVQTVRSINTNIQILGDLQGPKIRLGNFSENNITLHEEDIFLLTTDEVIGDKNRGSVDYKGLVDDIQIGSHILINDGEVELTVTDIDASTIKTIVKVGGIISSRKGVNVPGTTLSLPAITEKDKQDIQFLVDLKADYIACSFIRKASNIEDISEFIKKITPHPPKLMAKIETLEAIHDFLNICKKSDAIMIARGDLGVELPYQWIPFLQKAMIHECNKVNKYVVTATQMLQSMTEHAVPTRAEVTDIFQAVLDGTDAVMLSAESASGHFPIESTETLTIVSQFADIARKYNPYDFTDMLRLIHNEIE